MHHGCMLKRLLKCLSAVQPSIQTGLHLISKGKERKSSVLGVMVGHHHDFFLAYTDRGRGVFLRDTLNL